MQRQLDAIVQLNKFKGIINQSFIFLFTHVIHCSSYNVSNNNQHIFVSGTNEKYKTIQKYCCQQNRTNTAKEKSKIATFTFSFCDSSQVKCIMWGFPCSQVPCCQDKDFVDDWKFSFLFLLKNPTNPFLFANSTKYFATIFYCQMLLLLSRNDGNWHLEQKHHWKRNSFCIYTSLSFIGWTNSQKNPI